MVKKLASCLGIGLALIVGLAGCGGGGGGGGSTTNPGGGNPPPPGGDPREPIYFGAGNFTPRAGQYTDKLTGVAVNNNYVYVTDKNVLYAFNKLGVEVNEVASPNTPTKGVVVIPPDPRPNDTRNPYPYPNSPVVAYPPRDNSAPACTIYAPNLADTLLVWDENTPDIVKRVDLPRFYPAELIHPNATEPQPSEPLYECVAIRNIGMTRDGSIMLKGDWKWAGAQSVTWPNAIQLLDPRERYLIYFPPDHNYPIPPGSQIPAGTPNPLPAPCFHISFGDQLGAGSDIAFSSFYPSTRTDQVYFYVSGATLDRNFVGVSTFEADYTPPLPNYYFGGVINNPLGFARVIGESSGSGFGSFAINPPISPDGGLEDSDITAGGPAGIGIDPRTDDVYICDPGNRRIQVFDRDGNFLRQIGSGIRGTTGNNFLAPSKVAIDLDGTIYVVDVGALRVLRERPSVTQFGNIAGVVRNPQATPMPALISDAQVTVANDTGLVAATVSDFQGQYQVNNLPIGPYYLMCTKFNYDSDQARVVIYPDQTTIANFNLYPKVIGTTGSYTGYVLDAYSKVPLQNVVVQIVGTSMTATTAVDGSFVINDIAAGTYQATFTLAGYDVATRDVIINQGATFQDLVQLNKSP